MNVHCVSVRLRRLMCLLVCASALCSSVFSVFTATAHAADSDADGARAFHEKAKAAFALSHYAQAADYFEKAFELKSDPALLFNAAQSHRLAGNKERALTLYQNYLRVYGRDERRAAIDSRIEELKRAIEHDRAAGVATQPKPAVSPPSPAPSRPGNSAGEIAAGPISAPPPSPPRPAPTPAPAPAEPSPSPAPTVPIAPPPAVDNGSPSPMLLTQSAAPASDDGSVTRKPWFWIVVGGGVAAAAAAVLFVTLSGSKDPSPSLGSAPGN